MGYERFSLQFFWNCFELFFIIHSCHSLIMVSALIHGSSPIDSEIWRFGRVIKSIKCYERVHNISAQEQRHSSDLEYMQGKMRGRACKTHVGVLVPTAIYVKDCQNVCQMIRYDSDYLNVWISSKDECDYEPPCQPFHCHLLLNCGSNQQLVLLAGTRLKLLSFEEAVSFKSVFTCFHLINPCQVDLTSNLLGHSRQQLVAVKWALLHGKMNFMSFFRALVTCKTKFDTSCRPDSDLENSYPKMLNQI